MTTLQGTPADEWTTEDDEGFVNVGASLEANAQAPEVMSPGMGALDDPAHLAQFTAMRFATAYEVGCDVTSP